MDCAATRSDINGLYTEQIKFTKKAPVKLLFDLYYYTRQTGFDAIPKFSRTSGISDFDDIFKESIKQISNIDDYETFINTSAHIDDIEKRRDRENKIENSDYVIKLEILQENSFSKHVLGSIFSIGSLDIIPIGYSWDYTMTATIFKKNEVQIGKYSRNARVTNWHQILLIVAYPFSPVEGKTEEVYLESLTDLFKQIENENILVN